VGRLYKSNFFTNKNFTFCARIQPCYCRLQSDDDDKASSHSHQTKAGTLSDQGWHVCKAHKADHTKANLANVPALVLRFRATLYFGGHILSIQSAKTHGEHTTLCPLAVILPSLY
jgi:hypothetical protein